MDTPIGKLITGEAHRDAIHVAIAPATAQHLLKPGAKVDQFGSFNKVDPVGIVDPFLTRNVQQGERFYIFLFPNTVTGMRHHWSHPAFQDAGTMDSKANVEADEAWIISFADRVGLDYDDLMEAADLWIETNDGKWGGEYLNRGGLLEGQVVPDEFWDHYDKVRGVTTASDKRGSFFACSC